MNKFKYAPTKTQNLNKPLTKKEDFFESEDYKKAVKLVSYIVKKLVENETLFMKVDDEILHLEWWPEENKVLWGNYIKGSPVYTKIPPDQAVVSLITIALFAKKWVIEDKVIMLQKPHNYQK